jgi:hypothetical protein
LFALAGFLPALAQSAQNRAPAAASIPLTPPVDEAAGREEVERARPPHGSRASYGNSGRDAQEPGLVFLGIVDELDELLRRLGNNSE